MPTLQNQFSVELFALVAVVFLIAGFIKGVIGVGLPSVSIALLAATLELKSAIVILVLPALFTNIVQGLTGGAFKAIIKRIWVYLFASSVFTWIGSAILASNNSPILSSLLGALLGIYALVSLTKSKVNLPERWEPTATPFIGSIAGIFSGLTGSFVVPGVMYLQALNFSRDQFIQAMGISFTIASASLGVAVTGHGLMTPNEFYLSTFALLPAFMGMFIGVLVRKKLNDKIFRRVFFISLLFMGFYIIVRTYANYS